MTHTTVCRQGESSFASSTSSASLDLSAAEKLCRIYFEIAAEMVGEEEVRRRRDIRLQAAGSGMANDPGCAALGSGSGAEPTPATLDANQARPRAQCPTPADRSAAGADSWSAVASTEKAEREAGVGGVSEPLYENKTKHTSSNPEALKRPLRRDETSGNDGPNGTAHEAVSLHRGQCHKGPKGSTRKSPRTRCRIHQCGRRDRGDCRSVAQSGTVRSVACAAGRAAGAGEWAKDARYNLERPAPSARALAQPGAQDSPNTTDDL